MMKQTRLILLLAASLLVGCGGPGTGQKVLPMASQPPAVPATKNVPVDDSLLSAAKHEISLAMNGKIPALKAHAIEASQRVLPEENQNEIWAATKDKYNLVRFAAVMAIGHLKIVDAKPELLELVDDPNGSVRVAAIYALHRMGDYRYSKDLEHYSQDPDDEVRGNTALVLGLLDDPSALNVLTAMRRDENSKVRLQVAESMWRLGSTTGRDALIVLANSRYPDDQMAATMSLAARGDASIRQTVRTNLTSDYLEVALVAARVMGELGSDSGVNAEGYGVALNGAKSPNPQRRALAALAFGSIGRLDAQPILAKLLKDENPEVRIAAATGLLQIMKQAEK